MKRILDFELFESSPGLSEDQENFLNKYTSGTWKVGTSGKVSITGSFDCSNEDLKDLMGIKFSLVTEIFDCSHNDIKSTEGFPINVDGDFICDYNDLVSLKGSPGSVGGSFSCVGNKLKNLEGLPSYVGKNLDFSFNKGIKDLSGLSDEIGGSIFCKFCSLVSLEGLPEVVNGNLDVSHNKLKNLKGCPKEVKKSFNFSNNEIESLVDFRAKVGVNINCSNNNISNLLGIPVLKGKLTYKPNNFPKKSSNIIEKIADVMRKESLSYSDAIFKGWSQTNPASNKDIISDLMEISLNPKEAYLTIQSSEKAFKIFNFIEVEMKDVWEKINSAGGAKSFSVLADIGF